jgi:hypothetical protein
VWFDGIGVVGSRPISFNSAPGLAVTQRAVGGGVLPVGLAIDVNRDGIIASGESASQEKPFKFWINNDRDIEHDDIEPGNGPNSVTAGIDGQRDLEDFVLLRLTLPSALVDMAKVKKAEVGFCWVGSTGAPSVRVFPVPPSTNTRYLEDYDTAVTLCYRDGHSENATTIDASSVRALPNEMPAGWVAAPNLWFDKVSSAGQLYLLMEGINQGRGKLCVALKINGGAWANCAGIYMDLVDVRDMFETWTVGDLTTPGSDYTKWPASSATRVSSPGGNILPLPQTDQEKDYIMFVHGWNMSPFDKRTFASTAFKRLWHQGYKGRFGSFQWPTFYYTTPIPTTDNFDGSEQRAWNSGAPLADLLFQISQTFQVGGQSRVRLYAHSMGNVVASECIRHSASTPAIHTYVSAQAALSAHVWDNTTPLMADPLRYTPNVYGFYWQTGASASPKQWQTDARPSYMAQLYMPASVRYINHFNPLDYALDKWRINQKLKPDNGYGYGPQFSTGFESRFWKRVGQEDQPTQILDIPTDRLEIFSYAAESHSFATGAEASVGGCFGSSVNLNMAPFNFGDLHEGHSAQFLSTIQKRWSYWQRVIQDMNIVVP